MLTRSRYRRWAICLAICFGGLASRMPAASAQEDLQAEMQRASALDHIVVITSKRHRVEVTERLAKVIELAERIIRVDGFDPEIIEVKALAPNRIRVQALMQGVTTLVLTDVNDQSYVVQIFVNGDARHLQAVIDNRFPDSAVEAFKIQEAVALTGWVSQPEHITQIVEIAEQFYPRVLNHMQVGGVQQVKLNVRIIEVQRNKLRNLGMGFQNRNTDGGFLRFAPGFEATSRLADASKPASVAFQMVGGSAALLGVIDALKQEDLLKVLAEPTLVTTNGHPATMLSGGEFPVIIPQSLGTFSIQWRKFGVEMEAVPLILGAGRLRLEVKPSVSERDFSNAQTLGGLTVPALQTRMVNTEVEMRFGQTLMLAGLLSTRQIGKTSKIPLLGELPWAGALFRSVHYEDVETELVIIITPELVAPLDRNQVPAGGPGLFTTFPTDRELFGDGFLEVPNYGDPCSTCGGVGACGVGCQNYSAQPQVQMLPVQERTVPAASADKGDATRLGDSAGGTTGTKAGTETTRLSKDNLPGTRIGVATQVGYEESGGSTGRRATTSDFVVPPREPSSGTPRTTGSMGAERPARRPTSTARPGLIEP